MIAQNGTERARNTLASLRRNITTGVWPVGARLPIESELAASLGVGRSTIREAVRSLASMGMLETLPGRGTFVRSSSPSSTLLTEFLSEYTLEELLSYRRALEVEAAQQAAHHRTDADIAALEAAVSDTLKSQLCPVVSTGRMDAGAAGRFHALIFDAARNRLLASLYGGITDRLSTPENIARLSHVSDAAAMQQEHENILDAIRRGDFIDAVHAMADHVDNDLVILTPDEEIIPALPRSRRQQERIDAAREIDRERVAAGEGAPQR